MREELRQEVDRNYDYFQRNLGQLMRDHADQYALIKSLKIIGFYDGPGEALRAGLAQFPDKLFSIQQVTTEIDELGCMSVGVA